MSSDKDQLIKSQDKPKKYLILTSSGGGGHVNAAQARRTELMALGISADQIDIVDLMGLYTGPGSTNSNDAWIPTYSLIGLNPVFSGSINTKKWDQAQREGTEEAVQKLEELVELQPFAENLQAHEVKKRLTGYLAENNVAAVFNTQALSTPAICQAIVEYNNKSEDEKLSITTTVTDLITHRADHFLNSLQKLTSEQQKVLQMEIATAPMTDPEETEEQFLEKYGIPNTLFSPKATLTLDETSGKITRSIPEDIEGKPIYKLPVKKEVIEYNAEKDKDKIRIKANYYDANNYKEESTSEYNYLAEILGKERVTYQENKKATKNNVELTDHDIEITKGSNDKLIFMTMGSQGSNTVLEYMDTFKEQISNLPDGDGKVYLCIAAGKAGTGSLYERVKDQAASIMDELPENIKSRVKILPLAFQDGKHMASLLNNSDVLITRSGGMSAMEAKETAGRNTNRRVFVHSEAKLKYPNNFPKHSFDATYEALMTGTVKWEGGNAEYLLRNIEASLGSPELIDFGFSNNAQKEEIREDSLFHFAYDKKLTVENHSKIKKLIREGSNPNMRFAGGSYLIDHCQDFETKLLLIKYGAHLTAKSLEPTEYDKSAAEYSENKINEYQKLLQAARKDFEKNGFPKPDEGNKEQQKAYLYLNPMQPNNALEKVIVGMDKIGNFIKNKILMADYIHDCLDATRMYLRTDPTEKRSPIKRLKQLRNFTLNAAIFIAKQPIYGVTKPIALVSNIVRAGLIGAGMLYNDAMNTKSNITSYEELKETGKKILLDTKDSLIAWGTGFLVLSGFGVPVAFTIGGASASISFGAANFGAASVFQGTLNQSLIQTVALTSTPAGSAVLTAETVAEWAMFRPLMHIKLNPLKLFYKEDASLTNQELNPLGKKVKELYKTSTNSNISIDIRRNAQEEMDHILKGKKIEHVAASAAKVALTPFKELPRKSKTKGKYL